MTCRLLFRCAVFKDISHLTDLKLCLVVAGLAFLKAHVCDEDYLLTEVVKCDDLVKEHEVNVLEVFSIFGIYPQCLFPVGKEVV